MIPGDSRLGEVLAMIDSRRQEAVSTLAEFLRIPSVSADPIHAEDMEICARWLCDQFSACGFSATVEKTPGHPVVLARNQHQTDRPTVLLYGHYDVQPPDPIDQWITPPFEPTVRLNDAKTKAIYARGAADDKGQIFTPRHSRFAGNRRPSPVKQASAPWSDVGFDQPATSAD